ncbi:hypothetical protein [Spirosoma linguale]|uniref:Uncharacterized protein n=1 Tax=Spirosoma linguale (strain ATCC 33905 / DSM 74 / LMG 10896 / Claus 1) TaxID=504472 RepID=D2QHV7_SPILD|nr:hypothetical protein Slin_3916 [Spirosoma linguale DSM 74]
MKKISFLIYAVGLSFTLAAQQYEPVNPAKDKLDYQGYTIRLMPGRDGSYGYSILKGKAVVAHQMHNPVSMAPVGLRRKEDVYKVARWQIEQVQTGKSGADIFAKPLPTRVAQELQIKDQP